MWAEIAGEMAIPWRASEAMHWQLGEAEMARRAAVVPITLTNSNNHNSNNNSQRNPANKSRPRRNCTSENLQQLPSFTELTAGLPMYSHSHPRYPFPDPVGTPGTPYQHLTLLHPGQFLTSPPNALHRTDYFTTARLENVSQ